MSGKYEFDKLDIQILSCLQAEARTPYLEIARKLITSGGTIHQRVDKMKDAGVIEGSNINLNLKTLGYDVTVFLGIHLNSTKDLNHVISEIQKLHEVVELYYTTGSYGLLAKVIVKSMSDFQIFLMDKLQKIEGVQSTDSTISLFQPIQRELKLEYPET